MKKTFLKIFCMISLYAVFYGCGAVSQNNTENLQNATVSQNTNLQILKKNKKDNSFDLIEEFFNTIKCDELKKFDKNSTDELLNYITVDNKNIHKAVSSCDLTILPKNNIKEYLSVISIKNCVNSELFDIKKECGEFAVKIGEKLKKDGLNFALLDKYFKQNFKTLNNEYFIDLLKVTNNYEILKFYLDNNVLVNNNSWVLNNIGGNILIFISQNCDTTKEALKLKKATPQILEFVKTKKYNDFRDKQLQMALEILKHSSKNELLIRAKKSFEDIIIITDDEVLKKIIDGE